MKKKWILFCIFILLAVLWGYSLFFIPTFDLDESLYRRVAEEMKVHEAYWKPSWDIWFLFHKPPVFYWIIIFFSKLFHDAQNEVSTLAARIPSLLASIGILITLYCSRDFVWGKSETSIRSSLEKWFAPLLYLSGLFPILTGTAVIFDPLQTLLFLPSLLIPTRYFIQEQWKNDTRLPGISLFFWSMSLFAATAIKGLNGITIPSFAFGLQLLLLWISRRKEAGSFRLVFREGLRFLCFVFIPAVLLCYAWFYFLDQKMGREFTHEFFWVQHLNRSEEAMETHGGGIFYHPVVLFFAGGFLSSFFIFQIFEFWNTRVSFVRYGFPIAFVFSFIFAFTFSATKLPHYTWPIWPALALAGAIQLILTPALGSTTSRVQRFIASLPVMLLGMVFLAGALNLLDIFKADSFGLFGLTDSARTILNQFPGFHGITQVFLFLGAAICFLYQVYRLTWIQRPLLLALAGVSTALLLSLSVMPTAVALLVTPPNQIGTLLQKKYLKGNECIRYAGPHSPTLSLAIGYKAYHNRCEPQDAVFLIVPAWKIHECEDQKFTLLEKQGYLYLCGKPPVNINP